MYQDPRGPRVLITAVETGTGPTILTLSCGHRAERVNHFSYRVGEDDRCLSCARSIPLNAK